MGLRDDDEQIFRDRAMQDWANEYPEPPGDYDHAPTEEESAAHDHAVKKWAERRPRKKRYADCEW
jgi:hypothetical protein